MKTKLLIIAGILMYGQLNIKAQITLDHQLDSVTFGGQFYCTDIGSNEYKYVFIDTTINGFHLYNMNMTPYLTVNIPFTGTNKVSNGYTAIYITRGLFDCDTTTIEYMYEKQVNGLYTPLWVYRTDGTQLLKVDSANGPYGFGAYGGSLDIRPIQNTSAGTKLFIQKRNQQYGSGIFIYSLCGSLSQNIYNFSDNKNFVKIFPNPTSKQLTFEIIPPNNQEEFQLIILDGSAKEHRRENISLINNRYTLDVGQLAEGIFFYSLTSKNKVYQTGKFIITK